MSRNVFKAGDLVEYFLPWVSFPYDRVKAVGLLLKQPTFTVHERSKTSVYVNRFWFILEFDGNMSLFHDDNFFVLQRQQ